MNILKFEPILKTTLWGGNKIAAYKGLTTTPHNVGESWEISGVRGSESRVAEGEHAGMTLPELIAREKGALVGEHVYERFGTEFPLLIKFIDAREELSIQVHPDDALARRRHNTNGKSEMWYVVDADPHATLRSGFAKSVTPAEYEAAVNNHTITDLLRQYNIRKGDLFFLPAGRVHSIGAGAFIAEIQQTSDITYRIWDFDRRGADGKPRELHTELARKAIDYTLHDDYRTHYTPTPNGETPLVSCPHFISSLYDLERPAVCDCSAFDSFVAVMCTEGAAMLIPDHGTPTPIRAGETLLVPASVRSLRFDPAPRVRLLTSRIG